MTTSTTKHESTGHPACEPCDTEQTSKKTNTKSKSRRKKSTQAEDCPTGDCGTQTTGDWSNSFDVRVGDTGDVFQSAWRFGE